MLNKDFSIDGKAQTQDDCFDIKQNKAKTYWYTILDCPFVEIHRDGQTADSKGCAFSSEYSILNKGECGLTIKNDS